MADYVLAVGTHDPHGFSAKTEREAIGYAATYVERRYADDLTRNPQEVVTLLGPAGLLTRPSERIDEFVRRLPGAHSGIDPATIQPGDTNTPDCNGS